MYSLSVTVLDRANSFQLSIKYTSNFLLINLFKILPLDVTIGPDFPLVLSGFHRVCGVSNLAFHSRPHLLMAGT